MNWHAQDTRPPWPYGVPDPEPPPEPPPQNWLLWWLGVLLLVALVLTCIGLTAAMQSPPGVDQCSSVH